MRIIVLTLCLVAMSFMALGCESVGKGAGYVTQEAKEVPGELKRGYEEGKEEAKD